MGHGSYDRQVEILARPGMVMIAEACPVRVCELIVRGISSFCFRGLALSRRLS